MMECTAEEIERKRRQALAKLQARKSQTTSPNNSFNSAYNGHNLNVSSPKENVYQNQSSNLSSMINARSSSSVQAQKSVFSPYLHNNGNDNKNEQNSPNKNNFNPKILPYQNNKPHNNSPYTKPSVSVQNFFGKTVTGTMAVISENRFEINLQGYHAAAIEIFKSIPSKAYEVKNKTWNFELKDYKLILSKLQSLRPEVVVGEIPSFVLKELTIKKYDEDVDLSKIDGELLRSLLPFQRDGVIFGINRKGRVLIADDMGLGKTFQALGIAHYYKEDWPMLIATTATMRHTWQETIQNYLPSVPLMAVQYMTSGKDYIQEANVLIVSRDMLSRCLDKLLERKFGVLILDESHEFKNFKTKAAQSATKLAKFAKRVILLSGTPALSRPSELYTQLALIDERFFGNFIEYSKRYCDGKSTNFGWDASGKSNLPELEILLSKKFMIRRTKNDVLQALPSKTREVIMLDLSLSQIDEEEKNCLNELIDNYKAIKKGQEKHTALLSLFAETANIKIPAVCTYILKTIQENVKFLVFAHHQRMLDAVCSVLRNSNVDYMRIDGATTQDQRKFFIEKFQNNDNCRCAILSITATNAGITLTAAQLVIFTELHWNPSILAQAESRAHRIGQQNDVQVRYLLADGTSDDYIWPMLLEKQVVLNEAGLTKDSFEDIKITAQKKGEKKTVTSNFMDTWLKRDDSDSDASNNLLQDDNDDLFLDIDVQL